MSNLSTSMSMYDLCCNVCYKYNYNNLHFILNLCKPKIHNMWKTIIYQLLSKE